MQREIIEYPKERYGFRSNSKKLGVRMLPPSQRMRRKVLVLGTGRCGTTTVAKVLQTCGLEVDRERVGRDGCASLYFVCDSDWYPAWRWKSKSDDEGRVHVGERRSDFIFDHVLHVVRHPCRTIPSMGAIFPALNYEWFEDNGIIPHGIKSQALRCMHAYYRINMLAEDQAEWRFQIEELMHINTAVGFSAKLGVPLDAWPDQAPMANKSHGYKKREPMTWGDMRSLDVSLTKVIRKMAQRYGYEE